MKSLTWRLTLIALFLCAMAAFTSCGSNSYSPLDTYCKAVVKNDEDSARVRHETEAWLNNHK